MLAPSARARDLQAGRRALRHGELTDVVAVAPSLPLSTRSSMPIPVGVRANVATALARGAFDVVHAVDPGVPGLSYVALVEALCTTVAAFLDPERLSYPPRKTARDRLLARIDVLIARSDALAERASDRFPGSYVVVPEGVDPPAQRPTEASRTIAVDTTAS